MEPRFYVKREECWGWPRHVWTVYDRKREFKFKTFKTEVAAQRHCKQREADWQRYYWAIFDKRFPRKETA